MFPEAKNAIKIPVNETSAKFIAIVSGAQLRANASLIGVGEGGIQSAATKRYLVYRVTQLDSAIQIDDTTAIRNTPPGAAYYVRKIYYGRKFELVISADENVFTASVQARFLALSVGTNIEQAAKESHLNVQTKVTGLAPVQNAMFAQSAGDIVKAYKNDVTQQQDSVPILVEYRQLPQAATENEPIDWKVGGGAAAQALRIRKVKVDGANPDWTDSGLMVEPADTLLVLVRGGSVRICKSCWADKQVVDSTNKGSGGLDLTTGGVGSQALDSLNFTSTGVSGAVKLRVRDSDHKDNSGSYEVLVIVIPGDQRAAANCGDAPCESQLAK